MKIVRAVILTLASLVFTGYGIYLLFQGDITNGLLSLILGELIDIRACIISAVFKSFCHSHLRGNPEIVPSYINLDSRFHGNDDF